MRGVGVQRPGDPSLRPVAGVRRGVLHGRFWYLASRSLPKTSIWGESVVRCRTTCGSERSIWRRAHIETTGALRGVSPSPESRGAAGTRLESLLEKNQKIIDLFAIEKFWIVKLIWALCWIVLCVKCGTKMVWKKKIFQKWMLVQRWSISIIWMFLNFNNDHNIHGHQNLKWCHRFNVSLALFLYRFESNLHF